MAAAFGSLHHGFGPGARAQFPEQGFDVEFHGVQRDVQATRDRLVGQAFGKRDILAAIAGRPICVSVTN